MTVEEIRNYYLKNPHGKGTSCSSHRQAHQICKRHDLTIVDIACRDIRSFYSSMNLTVEEFIEEKEKFLH